MRTQSFAERQLHRPAEAAQGRLPTTDDSDVSVVIVQHQPAVRRGLELLLRSRGLRIAGTTASAESGYDMIGRRRPTVALIDADLPDNGATTLTNRLLDATPVISPLIYARDDQPALQNLIDCGVHGIALKIGQPDELCDAIRTVAGGQTYIDPRLDTRPAPHKRILSPREQEVLALLARGRTGEAAAQQLYLSPETIRTHVRNAMNKLGAHTRAHAIVLALMQGELTL